MTTNTISPAVPADLRHFRQQLHKHPETGFGVSCTAAAIAERLRAAGLEVTTGVGRTGVVATLRRGNGKRAIGLRADMDALPITERNEFSYRSTVAGRFHGCGHDGHSTMLLGAAVRLAEKGEFNGQVHFLFQPDEENGRGAKAMIDDGLFDHFPMDAIYGLHNLPGLPVGRFATQVGALTAFEETFEIIIQGRGGHASSPDQVVDPVVVGAEVVLALQSIVARALSPRDHGVVSVTEFLTDGARNIIPGTVTIRGDARGYSDAVGATIERRMEEIVAGVTTAHRATGTLRYQREFEPLLNTPSEVEKALDAAAGIPGAEVDGDYGRVGFSEDFAQFLLHRPGCFILMGNGTEGSNGAGLHNPHYDFNDAALPFGMAYWTRLVYRELGAQG